MLDTVRVKSNTSNSQNAIIIIIIIIIIIYWVGDQIYVYFVQENENWKEPKREQTAQDSSISLGKDDLIYCICYWGCLGTGQLRE